MILLYRGKPSAELWADFWRSDRGEWVGLAIALGVFFVIPIAAYIALIALQSIL